MPETTFDSSPDDTTGALAAAALASAGSTALISASRFSRRPCPRSHRPAHRTLACATGRATRAIFGGIATSIGSIGQDAATARRYVSFMNMNRFHRLYCRSSHWRRTVRERLLPWALAGVHLGETLLE